MSFMGVVHRFGYWRSKNKQSYWLTRFVLLRALGFVYVFAFLSLALQVVPLIGTEGLLPADNFLEHVQGGSTTWDAFARLPTLFWIGLSNTGLQTLAWIGFGLSLLVLFGLANVPLLSILWFLYMSFYHIGQVFYGYGWEIQLLETGFLAIFLAPLWNPSPFAKSKPSTIVIWLFRWLAFRVHIGAGLIKIRGAECWRDLTCLFYHYETQPIPGPLSPLFHRKPEWVHKIGVAFTHFVQLGTPWFLFTVRKLRIIATILMLVLQLILILSGNLAFLNWITIVAILAGFDDRFWRKILPKRFVHRMDHAAANARSKTVTSVVAVLLFILIAFLSVPVITNLLSPQQAMNTSFNQLHLVNTYGAFGAIGQVRHELIIEGTLEQTLTENTVWEEYEFPAKPGDPNRRLPMIAPYQPRLDWQIWFAAMSVPNRQPWLVHLVWKLLYNDPTTLRLLDSPFDQAPEFVRIQFYRYEFSDPENEAVWKREYIGEWIPPVSRHTPGFREIIEQNFN